MRVPGFCTGCRKIKNVTCSAVGLASLTAGGSAQGVCLDCQQAEDDERRAQPLGHPGFPAEHAMGDHVEMWHEREIAPGTATRQVRDMHDEMHRRDPHGQQYGHRHVGRDHKVLPTRAPRF